MNVHNWWEWSGDKFWASSDQISSPKATNVIAAVEPSFMEELQKPKFDTGI